MSKKLLLIPIICLVLAIALILFWVRGFVGGTIITRKDVQLRNEISKIYNPEEKRDLGYFLLAKSYLHKAILENHKIEITEAMIEQEEKRIESRTREPQKLRYIKDLFKDDVNQYRKVFIIPTLAERMIYHDLFLRSDEIQKASLQRATSLLEKLRSGSNFEEEVKASGLQVSDFIVDSSDGVRPVPPDFILKKRELMKKQFESQKKPQRKTSRAKVPDRPEPEANGWYQTFLKDLQPGQFVDQPVNRGGYWMLLRMKQREQDDPFRFRLEAVVVPKENFDLWKENESQKIWVIPQPKHPKADHGT